MIAHAPTAVTPSDERANADTGGIAGHPRGLTTLFLTEFWERFSYYGMRALLVLYMTAPVAAGGLAYDIPKATRIYGLYTSSVYFTAVIGGIIADTLIGAYRSVLYGGIIIASGHFLMALPSTSAFFLGLVAIALGTGLLKPNISAMVGNLYSPGDLRRDSGFSIFYIGINLGGMVAPLVCGTVGQRVNWHLGFGLAGLGMTLGVAQLLWHRERVKGNAPIKQKAEGVETGGLNRSDVNKLIVLAILLVFSSFFWTAFEQAGSSLNLFAENMVNNRLFGYEFPSSWFQSVNSFFILLLAPVFSIIWLKLGERQPSSVTKFVGGLFFVGAGYLFLSLGMFADGKVGPLWLVALYFLHTVGELCLSPVGLSTVTKLAPPRAVGFLLGMWFVFIAIGNYGAGYLAGFFDPAKGMGAARFFFLAIAGGVIAASLALAVFIPVTGKLLGKKV
jgi:POT family proton-dependent oligopeptide transporter